MGSPLKRIGDKITAALVNPELDKVKAEIRDALKKAKDNPENSSIATIVLERGLSGFRVDLKELKIGQDQWASYESIYRKRFMMATRGMENIAIIESFEAKKLDAFVNDLASYTQLNEVIADCKKRDSSDPLKRLVQIARKNAPLLAGISAGLMAFLGIKRDKKKKKASKLDQAAAKADAVLDKGDKKKKKAKKDEGGNGSVAATETPKSGGSGSGVSGGREAGPVGAGTEVESVGSVKYEINPDHSERLNKEEFRKQYLNIPNQQKRNMFVLQQVAAGNASTAFEKLKITSKDGKMSVVMEVDRSGLQVGGMDVPLDGPTAMAAALLSNCTLPTPWISDQIYKAAKANDGKINFINYGAIAEALNIPDSQAFRNVTTKDGKTKRVPNGNFMKSARFVAKRSEMLKGKLEDKLQAGHFKDIVHPVPGKTKKGMLEIYGAYYSEERGGRRVQPVSAGFHGPTYSDYSHQLRRVRNGKDSVTVTEEDGKEKKMSLTEFYANKKYAKKFGFKAQTLGNPYITPELQEFVDEHGKKKGDKPKAPNIEAIAKAEKQKKKKDKNKKS